MEDLFSLKGKTALITGAGRGIGRAIALTYAEAGAKLMLCSRTLSEVETLAREVRNRAVRAEALQLDVSNLAQCRPRRRRPSSTWAGSTSWSTTPGRQSGGLLSKSPRRTGIWSSTRNLKGLFFLTQEIGRQMIAQSGGRIINISSVGSLIGSATRAAYAASKAGVNALTRVLAVEWGPHGVTVNAIAPSFVRTSMTEPLFASPDNLAASLQRTPLARFPEPVDIAAAALYLASDAGRNVSGQVIPVDGGRTVAP